MQVQTLLKKQERLNKMNKKGLSSYMYVFFAFAFISLSYIFSTVLIYETGKEYIIGETADIGREIFTNISPSDQKVTAINNIQQDYNAFLFPYDLFFLALWISSFSLTIHSAYKTKKQGVFSFFGYIFIGSLIVLLVTSFISQITTWFMDSIFNPMFSDSNVSIPIITFYFANMGLVNLIWWMILILVNVLDLSFISRTGRMEE